MQQYTEARGGARLGPDEIHSFDVPGSIQISSQVSVELSLSRHRGWGAELDQAAPSRSGDAMLRSPAAGVDGTPATVPVRPPPIPASRPWIVDGCRP
jgi:hypothetical protein